MDSMYETLLGMPLFAGVSRQRMLEIIGKYKFHFLKYSAGERIVTAGEMCTHLKSLINGSVRVTMDSHNGELQVTQTLTAPDIIAPDFFFGRTTNYPATVEATGNVGILQFDKTNFLSIINSDTIFLFNYLNILSMNAQMSLDGVLSLTSGSLEKRIAYWVSVLTQTNGSDITLKCPRHDMATVFGVPNHTLISVLAKMKDAGLIDYSANEIKVRNRRQLTELLSK